MNYIEKFRNIVVGIDTMVPIAGGRFTKAINFDNAATTPPFTTVLHEIINFAPWYSSVHRGTGFKSMVSSDEFERARSVVLKFVNADSDSDTVIFVKNTTEALNKLSYRLCQDDRECVILSTDMEHHSNDLPWRGKFKVDYINTDSFGMLDMNDLERKLKKYGGRVKLVTVAGASNVTGYINPIYKIASIAHHYDALLCVDGAQLVPHVSVDMHPRHAGEDIDFLAFSAHKMYAPFGAGVLIGPKHIFQKGEPDYVGGGTVKVVTHNTVLWDDPPHNEEAGTPNLMGIVALCEAIKTLNMIGMDRIHEYETSITRYTLERLKVIPGVKVYGDISGRCKRVGVIPFNIEGMHHSKVAEILSHEAGIAVRDGCFCAQPYVQKLLNTKDEEIQKYLKDPDMLRAGMVRISFGFYNNVREIDVFLDMLRKIVYNMEYYSKKYKS
ncbi:MAG: aminotransferase class V-fold PLP-dependent enzyme [Clostridiales bacterium]|nr:aminotransferase class V-fold PLP-dependent enzyme [Clostridiales bacterium]HBM79490.1 aminotransferase [Clostridiaceae bacterium]